MNLFLTEDGVLKLGYYGLTTQAECYSIKNWKCDGVRSFAPEVFRGEYEMKSDVWSFGIVILEMMGIRPYYWYKDYLTEEQVREIARGCLLGLKYLHERGIVHGVSD